MERWCWKPQCLRIHESQTKFTSAGIHWGGTCASPQFRGLILPADSPAHDSKWKFPDWLRHRQGWLRHNYAKLVFLALVGLSIGALIKWCRHAGRSGLWAAANRVRHTARLHRVFLICAAACTTAFAAVVTAGDFALVHPDSFGQFYDFQAKSLLDGRLDVPDAGISGEAFVFAGKRYGYFGPMPALLRLPLVIWGIAFAQVTRAAMLVAYIGCLWSAYLLLCDVFRRVTATLERPPAWLTTLFILNVGLGSTLVYLASRAFVYHEAILWGVMFALWSTWCALRYFAAPSARWWVGALACGVMAVHSRPPAGLYALTLLGVVAALIVCREWKKGIPSVKHLTIGAAAVAGVASFNGLSYLKFRTFNGSPLRLHVQYDPGRIARIDGKEFHLSNVPLNSYMYFVEPNLEVRANFPWLFMTASKSPGEFRKAKIDYPDVTLALPYAQTGLCLLALIGIAGAGAFSLRRASFIHLYWVAAVPMTVAMCAAVAITHRYTADFCPALICCAAGGAAALTVVGRRIRLIALSILTVATVWSVLLTAAITLRYQGELVWGTPAGTQERYQQLQKRVDRWFDRGR